MNKWIKSVSSEPSFKQRGLSGYTYQLENGNLEIDLIDSHAGHDFFVVSAKLSHIYYVLEGGGVFIAGPERFEVRAGQMVELPPETEFAYSGKMKLLLILNPPFQPGAVTETRPNEDVLGRA